MRQVPAEVLYPGERGQITSPLRFCMSLPLDTHTSLPAFLWSAFSYSLQLVATMLFAFRLLHRLSNLCGI